MALWFPFIAFFVVLAMVVVVGLHSNWSAKTWAALALPALLLPSLLNAINTKIALRLARIRPVDSSGAAALNPPQQVVDCQPMEEEERSAGNGQSKSFRNDRSAVDPVADDAPANRGSLGGTRKSSDATSDSSKLDRREPARPTDGGSRLNWTPAMQEILSVLASELPQIGDMENCASQAGVSASRIRWGNRPDNIWQELLERASAQSRPPSCLQALLDAASRKSPEVERVVTQYRSSSDEHAS